MKMSKALVLLALAGSSTAFAAPRESATFTGVVSNGLQGSAASLTSRQTATFTGSDAGGAYSASYITIAGSYTVNTVVASYGSEASILVTPPTGTPFIINPMDFAGFPTGQPTYSLPAGRYAIPVSAIGTVGTWTFDFFEIFDDGTTAAIIDGTWNTVTITLNDGAPPAAPTLSGPNTLALNNVAVDGLAAAPGFSTTMTVPGGTAFVGAKLVARGTATNAHPTQNLAVSATPLTNVRVRITPPGGTAVVAQPWGNNTISTSSTEMFVPIAAANSAAGNWLIETFMTVDSPAGVDVVLNSFAVQLTDTVPPPPFVDAGTIAGGAGGTEVVTPITVPITATGQIKWVKFTTTAAAAVGGNFLDIFEDVETTISDTELGVYRTDGTRVANDDDDGVGNKPFLSFGAGGGSTVGDTPVVSNGRDGDLAAGTYYAATAAYDVTFGNTGYGVTTTGATLGTIVVKFATNIPPAAVNVCGAADIAGQGGVPGADNHLDNNDFVVFIDFFFNHNALADQGGQGGAAGADGVWDNNDFVVFIDNFFTAPASCR